MAKRFHSSGGMAPSGSGSHSNMPTELVMREYPKVGGFLPEGQDDGIAGIDSQIAADNSKKSAKLKPKKI